MRVTAPTRAVARRCASRHVVALFALVAALVLFAAGCSGGQSGDRTRTPAVGATVGVQAVGSASPSVDAGPTATPGSYPRGTVALFDVQQRTATKLDLGRALIRADWVDDGKTLVALDANSAHWVALRVDGTVVRDLGPEPQPSGESTSMFLVSAVHDGRRVALVAFSTTPSGELVDVFTGARDELPPGTALASFRPGGEAFAGAVWPVDADGHGAPSSKPTTGVFARGGSCGAAYCLAWQFPTGDGFGRAPGGVPRGESWSPDGSKLLVEAAAACLPASPTPEAMVPCQPDRTAEVYSWPAHKLLLSVPEGDSGEAWWAGNNALYVRGRPNTQVNASEYLVAIDGTRTALPASLHGCCLSFSPDGKYSIASAVPGEDCSLFDVASGAVIAGVQKGAGDTNDTGICEFVRWTPDGRYAIATGVSTP